MQIEKCKGRREGVDPLGTWNIPTYRFRPIPLSISPLKGESKSVPPLQGEDAGGDGFHREKRYDGIFRVPYDLRSHGVDRAVVAEMGIRKFLTRKEGILGLISEGFWGKFPDRGLGENETIPRRSLITAYPLPLTETAEALSFRVKSLRGRFAPRPPPGPCRDTGQASPGASWTDLASHQIRPEPLLLSDLRGL
jgi:hypothetical protein